MNIRIQSQLPNNSQTFQVPINPDSTVLELKRKVSEQTDVNADFITLVYGRKKLQDSETVQSYNLRQTAVVFVIYNLAGG
jgi:hypothetical protein